MELKWLGHSSFLIKDKRGRFLLTDPFDSSVGYKVYEGPAHVVTISHHHFDHDYVENVKDAEIVDKVGFFQFHDIPICGIPSYHDDVKGQKRGENTIYTFKMDDLTVCHMGDLGYILSMDEVSKIGNVDILLIPVGGNYTIDGKQAAVLTKMIKPKLAIPMHFKTSYLDFPIHGVEDYVTSMENGERVGSDTITIEGELTGENVVKILEI